MNDSIYYLNAGNNFFDRDDYANAIRSYTAASQSNSKIIQSDALLNRSLAYKRMRLVQHARGDLSMSLSVPYKNPFFSCAKSGVFQSTENSKPFDFYNSQLTLSKHAKKLSSILSIQTNHDPPNPLSDRSFLHQKVKIHKQKTFSSDRLLNYLSSQSSFFLENSFLQDKKDQNSWQIHIYYLRCLAFLKAEDFVSALRDAQTGLTLDPKNINLWEIKAKAEYDLNLFDHCLESIENIQRLLPPNHHLSPQMAVVQFRSFWLKRKYREAMESISPKIFTSWAPTFMNQFDFSPKLNPYQSTRIVNIGANDSIIFTQTNANIRLGRVSEVLKADPLNPLSIFATREFPSPTNNTFFSKNPFLCFLLIAIKKSMAFKGRKLYKILKPDFNIPPEIQQRFFGRLRVNPKVELSLPIGEPFKQSTIPVNFASKLLSEAIMIGKNVAIRRGSYRNIAMTGLAILEISQLITHWIQNDKSILPTLDLVSGIAASWARFDYPYHPIFQGISKNRHEMRFVVVKNGVTVQTIIQHQSIINRITKKIKDKLLESKRVTDILNDFGMQIDITNPETISKIFKTKITFDLPNTHAKLYIEPTHFSSCNIGITVNADNRNQAKDQLAKKWMSILMMFKNHRDSDDVKSCVTREIFEFWHLYMILDPFVRHAPYLGTVLFAALIHAFFGLAIVDGMPSFQELKIEIHINETTEEFVESIGDQIKLDYVGYDFDSVIDVLPDMQYRAAILLDVPNDDNLMDLDIDL